MHSPKRIPYFLFILAILSLCLSACSAYKSSYSATMLVRTEGGDHCEVHFGSLNGTLVLNAKVPADTDGSIHYDAELAEGEISVYYDVDGIKELLFTIKGSEEVDSRGGSVKKGDKVTIIIETVGKAKDGEIEIDFD